jgi:hypothetical protein
MLKGRGGRGDEIVGRMKAGLLMDSFGVVRFRDGWTLISAGRKWGRFAFKVDAEEAALRLAHQARARGAPVQIMVQGSWGEMTPMNLPQAG